MPATLIYYNIYTYLFAIITDISDYIHIMFHIDNICIYPYT